MTQQDTINDAIRLIKEASHKHHISETHIHGYKVDGVPPLLQSEKKKATALRNAIIVELCDLGHPTDLVASIFNRAQNTVQAWVRKTRRAKAASGV